MLPKHYRLPIHQFPRGARIAARGSFFVIKSVPNNLSHNRAGVIVSKGAVAGAVERNKTKRQVFAAFERNEDFLKGGGADHLVVINSSLKGSESSADDLSRGVERAMAKLKI